MDIILPNIVCYYIDKIEFGIVNFHFRKFVIELWPLIDVRFSFSPNTLRTNGYNFTKFVCALILARSSLGLLTFIFRKFAIELWPSIGVRISFPLNILRKKWIEFQ